jgi:hypothetical protein
MDWMGEKSGVWKTCSEVIKIVLGLGVVAHAYNPSYSGGGDLEDHGSRPAQTKTYQDPVSTTKPNVMVVSATWKV